MGKGTSQANLRVQLGQSTHMMGQYPRPVYQWGLMGGVIMRAIWASHLLDMGEKRR